MCVCVCVCVCVCDRDSERRVGPQARAVIWGMCGCGGTRASKSSAGTHTPADTDPITTRPPSCHVGRGWEPWAGIWAVNTDGEKDGQEGLPWWSSGKDSVLPLQEAWVRSPVREVLHALHFSQKKKGRDRKRYTYKTQSVVSGSDPGGCLENECRTAHFRRNPRLFPETDDPGRLGAGQMLRDGLCVADTCVLKRGTEGPASSPSPPPESWGLNLNEDPSSRVSATV